MLICEYIRMSKKTRQEKIIADLRRKLQTQMTQVSKPSIELPEPERKLTEHVKVEGAQVPEIQVSLIKKDLTKTLILTILAISLELVLYFLTRVGRF